ncbi:MAG TPA: gas vesicle protein [Trebonia sp.]|nr:gas vesicle protein [Trebonia sp.]
MPASPGTSATRSRALGSGSGHAPASLGDILERVLDKGLVIAGDIQVNLLDIELLTIKLRLVIASLETAREVGINWWETDPWLSADARRREVDRDRDRGDRELGQGQSGDGMRELRDEVRRLSGRIKELESGR